MRGLLAIVLLASAALFAVGSQIERNTETGAETRSTRAELRHDTTTSSDAATTKRDETGGESGQTKPEPSPGETAPQRRAEVHMEAKLFGINPEAAGLIVIAAVLVALHLMALLAGAALLGSRRSSRLAAA